MKPLPHGRQSLSQRLFIVNPNFYRKHHTHLSLNRALWVFKSRDPGRGPRPAYRGWSLEVSPHLWHRSIFHLECRETVLVKSGFPGGQLLQGQPIEFTSLAEGDCSDADRGDDLDLT